MMHLTTPDTPTTVTDLVRAGLLEFGDGCQIHPSAVFLPADMLGTIRPIALGDRVAVGAFTVVHGGTKVGRDTRIGHCGFGPEATGGPSGPKPPEAGSAAAPWWSARRTQGPAGSRPANAASRS